MSTAISWTDETWNPILGCTRVSPGCDNCYAITSARVRAGNPHPKIREAFDGLTDRIDGRIDWTGRINTLPDRLDQPLHWKKPRRVFVNSMSDLFHEQVPEEFIARVWTVMAATPQHTYQILTKRHARMRSVVRRIAWRTPTTEERRQGIHGSQAYVQSNEELNDHLGQPRVLPNVWLGVSTEDQKRADLRIPALLETPAAVRWISAEPLLGPIDLAGEVVNGHRPRLTYWLDGRPGWGLEETTSTGLIMQRPTVGPRVDWVVVGGESGRGARPMHPHWARTLRDQCQAAGVPFHFKQHGEWIRRADATDWTDPWTSDRIRWVTPEGAIHQHGEFDGSDEHRRWAQVQRVGAKVAGRELDGRTWDEYPAAPVGVAS